MSRSEPKAGADEPWMLEDGDAQAARFNGVTSSATQELLFGTPSDRFFAVAYEEANRWVGVLADPYFATSEATLPELENKLIEHIATERGRSPREVRLYTELIEADFAVDVLLRDWRDR